jgi:hypothetical protein
MNERIKQLAIKAGDDWEHTVKEDREFLEKFAKLVVQECCDIFVELRTRPADLAVKDVKKHFGVEE